VKEVRESGGERERGERREENEQVIKISLCIRAGDTPSLL
jgi:hypothetical protein